MPVRTSAAAGGGRTPRLPRGGDTPGTRGGGELTDFVAAFGPQPVIHCKRTDLPLPLAGPTVRQNGERQAVRTAGDGNGEKRRAFKLCDRGERGCELANGKRLG